MLRIDPDAGASMVLHARDAEDSGLREIHLDMDFASEGGAGRTPYEELLSAALRGDQSNFTRQDSVEETWRIVQPLIDEPPPVEVYEQGTWGPARAAAMTAHWGGWHQPWL